MVAERRLKTKVSLLAGSPLTPLRTLWVTRTSDEEQSDPVVRSLVKIRQESSSSRGFAAQFCARSSVARACIPEWDRSQANLALKVITVACDRGSLTRSSNYSELTCKLVVFWKTGRWGELVAYERRSQPEVRLYGRLCAHCDRTALRLEDFQYGGRSVFIRWVLYAFFKSMTSHIAFYFT